MGTNYYAITDECEHCGRYNDLHICKSLISFRGRFHEEWNYETHEHTVTPWLTTWAEWKDYLRSPAVQRVSDEYGGAYTVSEFIARVEQTPPEARRRQHDWMVKHEPARTGRVAPSFDWLDAEGFSFYGGCFS